MDADELRRIVGEEFPDARIEVQGGDGRYQLAVVSGKFRDLSRIKREQLVYGCLTGYIKDGSVHAVTIVAKTPEETSGL